MNMYYAFNYEEWFGQYLPTVLLDKHHVQNV